MKLNKDVWAMASTALPALLGLGHYALTARMTTSEKFGQWVIFLTGVGLMELVRTGLVQTGLIRLVSGKPREKRERAYKQAFFMGGLVGFAVALPIAALDSWSAAPPSDAYGLLWKWAPWVHLGSFPLLFVIWTKQAERDFLFVLALELSWVGLFLAYLIVHYFHPSWPFCFIPGAYLASKTLVGLASISYLNGQMWKQPFDKALLLALWRFGRYNTVSLASRHLLKSAVVFLIPLWQGAAAAGVYQLALKIFEGLEILMRGLLLSAYPLLASYINRNDRQQFWQSTKQYLLYGSLVACLLAAMLWWPAPFFTAWLGGGGASSAGDVLRILLLSAVLMPFERFSGVCLDAFNQPKLGLFKHLFMLGVSLLLSLLVLEYLFDLPNLAAINIVVYLAGGAFGWLLLLSIDQSQLFADK